MNAVEAFAVLDELSEGLRISIEAENAVVAALQRHQIAWNAARDSGKIPMALTRRVRQLHESTANIRRWKRELAAYEAVLATRPTAPASEADK